MSNRSMAGLCLLACGLGGVTPAATYDVTCPGGPMTIQMAVNNAATVAPSEFKFIRVTGTCAEKVVITSMRNLTIHKHPTAGAAGMLSPDALSSAVVNIADSFNIKVQDLTLDGNGIAGLVGVNGSQQVELRNLTLRNGSAGLMCGNNSWCKINALSGDTVTFTGLSGPAVVASMNSRVNFGNTETVINITDTRGGIEAAGGAQVIAGGAWSISSQRENASGIALDGALFTGQSCAPVGTHNAISGAATGISAAHNSSIIYSCALRIENNKTAIAATMNSSVRMGGTPGALIINNNTDSAEPRRTGGLLVSDNSAAILTQAQITGNQLAGVYVRNNGMVTLVNSTITGNLGDGVLVTQRAALYLPMASVWGANTGKDLVCTVQGTAYGNASGLLKKRMECRSFEEIP